MFLNFVVGRNKTREQTFYVANKTINSLKLGDFA